MSSNKKLLSILGFLGILIGLLCINIFFLKISKSVVNLSKAAPATITSPALSEESTDITTNEKPIVESEIIQSNKKKESISNLAFYLDEKKNANSLNSNEQLKNNVNNAELKQAAILPMNFLEINSQEADFKETNNQTIKERFPDFPSVDLDPPVKSKDNPVNIPIIDRNIPEAEAGKRAENNNTNTLNSTLIINNENNITEIIISENKTTCVDVLQENKNSTTIQISENRTIVIDLPKKEELNTTSAATADKANTNKSSTEQVESKQNTKANIIRQDTIVIVNKNQTEKVHNASVSVSEQEHSENVTVVNKTYNASNVTVDAADESCDFENDEQAADLNNTAVKADNDTEAVKEEEKPRHKAEHKNKNKHDHHENKHKKAFDKHHRNDKHHGKRCRNKKHAHYIELAEGESSNLIQESKIN